eukprot:jgi/Psemu1/315163/fgenesh1_kg.1914_\
MQCNAIQPDQPTNELRNEQTTTSRPWEDKLVFFAMRHGRNGTKRFPVIAFFPCFVRLAQSLCSLDPKWIDRL